MQLKLSRMLGALADYKLGVLTQCVIRQFIKLYRVDMREALQEDPKTFKTFNAFFTRALKPGARVVAQAPDAMVSPVDGVVSELGKIHQGTLIQAKGVDYTAKALLGGDQSLATLFHDGNFLTAYLAPKDYHRIHMPFAGTLKKMIYIPGSLFPVKPSSVEGVPNLFARNERVVCLFDTAFGPMAVIAVGALIVGSVATSWHGVVMPKRAKTIQQWEYEDNAVVLNKGDELGYFKLGSTVIILTPENRVEWASVLSSGDAIQMGQVIGTKTSKEPRA